MRILCAMVALKTYRQRNEYNHHPFRFRKKKVERRKPPKQKKKTYVHIIETLVDIIQFSVMSDIFVNLNFSIKVIFGKKEKKSTSYFFFFSQSHLGQLPWTSPGISVLPLTPPKAVPRQTRPVTSWNLEGVKKKNSCYNGFSEMKQHLRSSRNFLASSSNTDNSRYTPSLMTSFQRSSHDMNL